MSERERHNPDSIDDVLGEDHEHLGGLLAQLRRAAMSSSPDSQELARTFSRGLRNHMSWEEEALFPAVSGRATVAQRRSIESLKIDHDRLRDTLDSLSAALASGDTPAAQSHVSWLETLLKGHNFDEEHGVYVEADHYLTLEERRQLAAQFRILSGKAGP